MNEPAFAWHYKGLILVICLVFVSRNEILGTACVMLLFLFVHQIHSLNHFEFTMWHQNQSQNLSVNVRAFELTNRWKGFKLVANSEHRLTNKQTKHSNYKITWTIVAWICWYIFWLLLLLFLKCPNQTLWLALRPTPLFILYKWYHQFRWYVN